MSMACGEMARADKKLNEGPDQKDANDWRDTTPKVPKNNSTMILM